MHSHRFFDLVYEKKMVEKEFIFPEVKIKITSSKPIPKGSRIDLSVPLSELEEVTTEQPSEPNQKEETPPTTPEPPAVDNPSFPQAILSEKWPEGKGYLEIRRKRKDFKLIGNAFDMKLSGNDFSYQALVRFTNFDQHQRIIGSATAGGKGSSLQFGVLKGGTLWIDTFQGGLTGDKLEVDTWYWLGFSIDEDGRETLYINGKVSRKGQIPTFTSGGNIYLGRWLNTYHDFDIKQHAFFRFMDDEETAAFIKSR